MKVLLVSVAVALALLLQRAHCWTVQLRNITSEETDDNYLRLGIIFPGTKWCGSGNVAQNYEDLGQFADTDRCCRAHDHCENVIEAGQTLYGLTNRAVYTRLECMCDEEFYTCLKDAETSVSFQVGVTYFNVLNTQCFKKEKPIIKCSRYSLIFKTRCVEYELDETGEPIYQWFDVPIY